MSLKLYTEYQYLRLFEIRSYLAYRKNKSNDKTIKELFEMGYTPKSLRVTFTGGVGAYRMMRNGNMRIQVCSSSWANSKPNQHVYCSLIVLGKKKLYYKYAICIEIDEKGLSI